MFSWAVDEFDGNGKLILLYRLHRIIDENIVKSGNTVLDIGGWGKLSYRLYQEGCRVCLLNLDKKLCHEMKGKYNISFEIIEGDAVKIPFKSKTFDVITCYETLEHIEPEKRIKVIKEFMRVLKSEGSIAGTIPIPGHCHKQGEKDVYFLTPDEFTDLIKKESCNENIRILVEPTGSIYKGDVPPSWYFAIKT